MSPSAAQPPFDQGLFLTHFNKGREAYDAKRFEEALHELEEAYLLWPRDQRCNLLGLVYFKQDKLEKAEEVTQAGGERGQHASLQPGSHLLQAIA
jgi:tetratricopeptide (TPR) repeat protein